MLDQFFHRTRVRDRIRANISVLGSSLRRLSRSARPSPRHHPAVRPSRRTLRRLAHLRANRHRGGDPGDDRFLPPRASAPLSMPHAGPDLPVSGPGGPGTPTARSRHPTGISRPASPPNPVDVALEQYGGYIRDTCGLAESTCNYRARYAREFLQAQFADGPVRGETTPPQECDGLYREICRPMSCPNRRRSRPVPCAAFCGFFSFEASANQCSWLPSLKSQAGDWIISHAR